MPAHPEYERLFTALSSKKIRYCVLRDELDGGQLVGDLDLLVDEARLTDVFKLFEENDYHVRTTSRYLPFKTVLTKFADGEFIALDLYWRIAQNGIVILDTEEVLQRRALRDDYYLPAREDLLAILILHNVIGKSEIQAKHVPVVKDLAAEIGTAPFLERLAILSSPEIAGIVLGILRRLEYYQESPQSLAPIRAVLLKHYARVDPGLRRRLLRRRLMLIWRRWSPIPRAPLFALTGVDGVGKSSLNAALLEILNRPGGFPAVTEYMGPWGHYRLSFIKGEVFSPGWSLTTAEWFRAILARRSAQPPRLGTTIRIIIKMVRGHSLTDEEKLQHKEVRVRSRLFLTLRYLRSLYAAASFFVILTIEMYYRYFIVYQYRRRGITVVTDRYIYDLMTGRMHDYIPHYRRLRSFLCWIFPRPTRVFLLHNYPDIILERKNDLSEKVLRQFMTLYEDLADKRGFEKVRTSKPPDNLAEEIITRHFGEIVSAVRT